MAESDAEALLSDPDVLLAGSVFPFGKATATNGGFISNGRWTYASGIPHATHVFGFAAIFDGDAPRMIMPGMPALAAMMTPASNVEILPTWDVSGLSATGSNDFVMRDVFIPQNAAIGLMGVAPNRHYTGPLYALPFMTLFALPMASVALGIAQHAIDEMLDLAATKVPAGAAGGPRLAERPLFHLQLSEAQAAVASARAWFHQLVGEQYEMAKAGASPDLAHRNQTQLAASNATRSASRAVELMYLAGGGTANFRKSPLQRCMRDLHAVTQHVGTGPGTWEAAGAVIAGLPPANPFMLL
jgi:alkylation response protein AidB-like acyl-CoA dehydrogenase